MIYVTFPKLKVLFKHYTVELEQRELIELT